MQMWWQTLIPNDIHTVSDKFSFILYADDTTLISPLCSFRHCSHNDMNYVSTMINLELTKISDWLAVNKLSLNAAKTKFMLFHYYQKCINEDDIPHLTINDTVIERVTEFNFFRANNKRIHELELSFLTNIMGEISKISRTLGVMNRLKRYLPFSALKLMYSSLIPSHLQFSITSWGLNGKDYQNYKNEQSGLWPIVNTMHIRIRYLRAWSCSKLRISLTSAWNSGTNL